MSEVALSVNGLTKRFRKNVAVEDVSFSLPAGNICGLVGPNGADKTTTIRILMDLIRPDSGTVRVLGLDPTRNALDVLARVGYVPEKHHIYQWMQVQQVLEFAAGVYRQWDWACGELSRCLLRTRRGPSGRRLRKISHRKASRLYHSPRQGGWTSRSRKALGLSRQRSDYLCVEKDLLRRLARSHEERAVQISGLRGRHRNMT